MMLLRRSLGAALLFLGALTVDPLGAPDLPGLVAAAGALLGLGLMVPNGVLLLTLTLGLSAARIDLAGPLDSRAALPGLGAGIRPGARCAAWASFPAGNASASRGAARKTLGPFIYTRELMILN